MLIYMFDYKFYLVKYPDLVMAGITTERQARNHYNRYGKKEGRICIRPGTTTENSNFDYKFYLVKYPNLVMAGITTERQARNHYNRYGKKEGRICIRPAAQALDKLIYKLKLHKGQNINIKTVNNTYLLKANIGDIEINGKKYKLNGSSNILKIYRESINNFKLYINELFIINISKITYIDLGRTTYYKCSINIPISLNKTYNETLVNFIYTIIKYIPLSYQINILHTDIGINYLDDLLINNDNLNYIYVENPYNFNLGYTRNLYKYLNLSENVIFTDVDIPIEDKHIRIMLKQTKHYDVIKPYDKKLINLTKEEKIKYLIKPFVPNRTPEKIYSITGGITLFKRHVLEECGGYEELNCYGSEDRFLDVMILYKGYRIKKNEFGLVHLWHRKLYTLENEWDLLSKKSTEFNNKYYNCTWDKRATNSIHRFCDHKTYNVDKLINHKKKYNANLNLFINNQHLDSIILKPELEL